MNRLLVHRNIIRTFRHLGHKGAYCIQCRYKSEFHHRLQLNNIIQIEENSVLFSIELVIIDHNGGKYNEKSRVGCKIGQT